MKLWLLSARRDLPADDDPWDPWFDRAFGFVVRAETEEEARSFPTSDREDACDYAMGAGNEVERWLYHEGPGVPQWTGQSEPIAAWTDPRYSTCDELTADGPAGIILRDFRAS